MVKNPSGEFSSSESSSPVVTSYGVSGEEWFGHPRGLSTLFFTEMWERFSYYGMRAILFLFLVAEVERGGFGLTPDIAGAIYGLYTAGVYLLALPGGWLADKLLGQRKAIWYGGIIIASGHFSMAVPSVETFYIGLVLIVIGTGLLKPNISAIVGDLYPEGGGRRDAGFSVFYMGINIGAFLAPLVCGYLGENINWHLGFAAAGIGMVMGLIQYRLTERHLGSIGTRPTPTYDAAVQQAQFVRRGWQLTWMSVGVIAVFMAMALLGILRLNALAISSVAGISIVGIALAFFAYVIFGGGLSDVERKRVSVIFFLFFFSAMFWAGFEQAGSSLNLFAERHTDRLIFGWEMPASWLQAVNPLLIITLAPIFGMIWIRLAQRNLEPSSPLKFAFGLILLGIGFLVMIFAARIAVEGGFPSPMWLVLTYLLHTSGELALSPVGLSTVTKLSPRRFVGQMMGIWFISLALGNLLAGRIAGGFDPEFVGQMPNLFLTLFLVIAGAGVILAIASIPLSKWERAEGEASG